MMSSPKRPAPGGAKVTHSQPTMFGTGSIKMPAATPAARFSVPKTDGAYSKQLVGGCKGGCPGSNRAR